MEAAWEVGSARLALSMCCEAADILCSDYYPAVILHAVFQVAAELGSLEAGKAADLIVVREYNSLPAVLAAFVGGRLVYQVEYGQGKRAIRTARPGIPG